MSSQALRKALEKCGASRGSSQPSEIPVSRTSTVTTRSTWYGDSVPVSRSHPSLPQLPPPTTHLPSRFCEECELSELIVSPIWNCAYCDMNFCDSCWQKQKPHKLGRTGPDGLPHEKGDPYVVESLKGILTPIADVDKQQRLHIEDEDTTWFSIGRDDSGKSVFQDYGRYASLISSSNSGGDRVRYPQLVAFIGQTGAGKSTLVKMLIDQQQRRAHFPHKHVFPSPIVGSVRNENVPTSGDVHLYADPGTHSADYPVLYADCEGLEGGENMPLSKQFCNSPMLSRENGSKRRARPKTSRGVQRHLKWANSPEKTKRQYAVTQLYPRLLYSFSDVIVFVLRNSKYVKHHGHKFQSTNIV
jgi:hypothetical protein